MKLAVLKETYPGERRVALVPSSIKPLKKLGIDVIVESGAGLQAGHDDVEYEQAGASTADRKSCFDAEVLGPGHTKPLFGSDTMKEVLTDMVTVLRIVMGTDRDWRVRGMAASLLGKTGAAEAVPLLINSINTKHPYVFGQVHQLTVDAYAVQHAGGAHPDKSVGVHLCGLHLVLVQENAPPSVPPLLQSSSRKQRHRRRSRTT